MKNTYFRLLLVLALLPFSIALQATHNRAGEITVRQLGTCESLMIEATITTYTKASSRAADRDTLTICWGDGNCEKVPRSNGSGQILPNDTKLNYYISKHTYAGRGTYTISMTDPNRIDRIININNGASVTIPFYIETVYTFLNPQFQGCNSTPELLQPPIDVGCVGQEFRHNPNARDPDKDSLSYELVILYQADGSFVPNYLYPSQVMPGPNNLISLNEVTGDFIWRSPQVPGEYNIAIMIIGHRNGIAIDTVIRDMQILIENCQNQPPDIVPVADICVVAGTLIEFPVTATAPLADATQKVELQAFGGPFKENEAAEFIVQPGFQNQPLTGIFRWQTTCNHISDQYYSVVFRAADNFAIVINNGASRDTSYLSTLETVRIKVVGPAPEDFRAQALPGQVDLSWFSPYVCEDADDEYFYGFSVWRREGSNQFQPDTCRPGLDGRGYTEIRFRTRDLQNGRYVFTDTNVERGRTYCYRVLARFARRTTNGQPYNLVEGLASDEVCVQLSRDLPLLTNVDVLQTDANNGQILVRWSKPKAGDLDTILNPGPYRYEVWRATGITNTGFAPVPGAAFDSPTFYEANDTVWTDNTGLNTVQNAYTYKIAFYVNGESQALGDTEHGSSVFLTVTPTDNRNNLTWQFDVPWENNRYTIFRDDDGDSVFDSIGFALEPAYSDSNLINGREYCYYVRSRGSYGVDGIINPIINNSQRVCGIPRDDVPPCPPLLAVNNLCNDPDLAGNPEIFENFLEWRNPVNICPTTDDVVAYRIYYAPQEGGAPVLIGEIDFANDTFFIHAPESGIAGCYTVTALDTFANESAPSNLVCVDNCPEYSLPNAFTPNGDNQNDVFKPYPFRFIEKIELKVYNRWGNLVFETEDPNINWTGVNLNGSELMEGVYYYTCKVFEKRVTGVLERPELLSGWIELVR